MATLPLARLGYWTGSQPLRSPSLRSSRVPVLCCVCVCVGGCLRPTCLRSSCLAVLCVWGGGCLRPMCLTHLIGDLSPWLAHLLSTCSLGFISSGVPCSQWIFTAASQVEPHRLF